MARRLDVVLRRSIVPSSSTTKVERMTPGHGLAVELLLALGAVRLSARRSGSDSSGNVMRSRSRNFGELLRRSGEMPTTSYPAACREASESRKSHACVVQPGVMAAG